MREYKNIRSGGNAMRLQEHHPDALFAESLYHPMMFHYYFRAIQKYAVFSGRARRREYWYFVLCDLIISVLLTFLDDSLNIGFGIGNVYSIALFIPHISVGVRRMHDIGKSGWYLLIPIYNIVLLATPGDGFTNEYGPDPIRPKPEAFDFESGTLNR